MNNTKIMREKKQINNNKDNPEYKIEREREREREREKS